MKYVLSVGKGLDLKGNWLQFFAEGEEGGEGGGTESTEPTNPLLMDDDIEIPDELDLGDGSQEDDQSNFLDFGGRKVNPNDPNALHDVYKDYSNLNATFTQKSQENKLLQQQIETLQQTLSALNQNPNQQQAQAQPQTPQAPQYSDEEIDAFNQELQQLRFDKGDLQAEKWARQQPIYRSVMGIDDEINQRVQELVSQQLAPLQEERNFTQAIMDMRENYADFDQYNDQIAELYKERAAAGKPMSHEQIEDAYFLVKGRNAQNVPKPEDLLNDQTFIQSILNNQDIQKQVIANYQKQVRQKQQNAPKVVGQGKNAGTPPALGEKTPKSMQDSTKAFLQYLGNI